ncbi:MAG: hypothetical protein OSB70_19410 [Myxococcota bacterium]|nr:hypothetical protein [Myxococcota bacterium]
MARSQRRPARLGLLDFLAFTGLWPAAVAAALVSASALAMPGAEEATTTLLAIVALSVAGTLVVYNVDRLRDLGEDRLTAPARSAFVTRHRGALQTLTGLSAVAAIAPALALPLRAWGVCALAGALGFFHRRLKKAHPSLAVFYITLAWTAVVVGLPAMCFAFDSGDLLRAAVAAGALGPAIAANLMASELRGHPPDAESRRRLRGAGAIALLGGLAPLAHPPSWPLILPALFTWASVVGFRNSERYGLLVLDGALLLGALAASAGLLATR